MTTSSEKQIVYKKTDEWYIEWQRVVQQETMSDNVWQWVTTNDNDDNKWEQMTTSDSEWLIFLFWNNRGTYHYKP